MERKVCFITGSGSGNGRAMAARMAELGYVVILHHSGRDPESAEEARKAVEKYGARCEILVENLYEDGAAERLFKKFRAVSDRLDVFINNAGKTVGGEIMDMTEEKFDYVSHVNWKAAYFCVKEAGLFMREKGIKGNIIIISSNHHLVNFGRASAYATMKEALVRYTKYAALEFATYGIRVNCIAPGDIDHEYRELTYKDSAAARTPLGRVVPSSELADIAEFLASPASASITGNTLDVDAGFRLQNYDHDRYKFGGKYYAKEAGIEIKSLEDYNKAVEIVTARNNEKGSENPMERKVCFITGSGSGNGRGMALRMAELGYDIAVHHSGRDPEMAEETKKEIEAKGVRCEVFAENLYEDGSAKRLFDQFREKFDRLDVFINNSGRTVGGEIMDMTEEIFDIAARVNWKAAYFCVKEAGLFMREKGIKGSIVIISSNHHLVNFGWASAYATMKEALVRYTKYAALEFATYGIRVNCIAPGNINPGYEKRPGVYDYLDREAKGIPLQRVVPSSELADIAEFLSSPAAASITGNTLDVDGGFCLQNFDHDHYNFGKNWNK